MPIIKPRQIDKYRWQLDPVGPMRVPVIMFADGEIMADMDETVFTQAKNIAALPGIVRASFTMPDAHQGYGFPIGGVAAFDAEQAGVVSAGGVGFDISCGVRSLTSNLSAEQIQNKKNALADELARNIPAGVGSTGKIQLGRTEMEQMLCGGAKWAVEKGFGSQDDLQKTEENGRVLNANPDNVSNKAKQRQYDQIGTLGSGNHYLEVQKVTDIFDSTIAEIFGLHKNAIVVSIHCGSRGLGHQIATDFLPIMAKEAAANGIALPEKELACAPIKSKVGSKYLSAMNCGINSAIANRQILAHLTRESFSKIFHNSELKMLYDVSHNTCKLEEHNIDGQIKKIYVHRKGATRAFGPAHPKLSGEFAKTGQPVIVGGSMGTASYILTGTQKSMNLAFGSCCHGAGRALSRKQAKKRWKGKDIVKYLDEKGIVIRADSLRSVAEEAPNAYKDIESVINTTHNADLAKKIARLEPLICVKG